MEKMVSRIERLSKLQANIYDEDALWQQAINIGKAKAEKRGIENVIEKGSEQKALDVARNMLKEKMDMSVISKVTGLSKSVIKTITF